MLDGMKAMQFDFVIIVFRTIKPIEIRMQPVSQEIELQLNTHLK